MNALIIENKPYCSKCKVQLGNGTGEYSLITHEGKNYVKFQRYCNSCRNKIDYYADITLEGTTRYSFNNDIEEVKDEVKRED